MIRKKFKKNSIVALAAAVVILAISAHGVEAAKKDPAPSTPASRDKAYAECDRINANCRRNVKRQCKRIEAKQLREDGGYFDGECWEDKSGRCFWNYKSCQDDVTKTQLDTPIVDSQNLPTTNAPPKPKPLSLREKLERGRLNPGNTPAILTPQGTPAKSTNAGSAESTPSNDQSKPKKKESTKNKKPKHKKNKTWPVSRGPHGFKGRHAKNYSWPTHQKNKSWPKHKKNKSWR